MLLAALADPSSTDPVGIVVAAFKNFQSGAYALGVALVMGLLVALAKQGWLSSWLADKLPKASLPYVAVGLSVLGTWATEMQAGASLGQAAIDALKIAALAVFGHQTVIEGLRKGAELVPRAPWSKGGGGPAAPPAPPPAPPAPPKAPTMQMGIGALAFGVLVTLIVLFGPGCTGAAAPVFSAVEQVVLDDLNAGKTVAQIEVDVARVLGNAVADGGGGVAVDIVTVVQDAVALLIDAGVVPESVVPYAKTVLGSERAKLAARVRTDGGS